MNAGQRSGGRVVKCDECGVLRPPQRGGKPRHWTCDPCYFGPEGGEEPDAEGAAAAAEVRRSTLALTPIPTPTPTPTIALILTLTLPLSPRLTQTPTLTRCAARRESGIV